MLESVVGGERFGRYSFIGLHARTLLRAYGERTEVVTDGRVVETHEGNPLDFIADFEKRFKVALRPGLPRFCGGLAGYFGYDAVRYIEKKLAATQKADDLGLPDIQLLLCEELAVIDNLSGKLYLIVYADPNTPGGYPRARARLRDLRMKLRQPVDLPVTSPSVQTEVFREFDKADYLAAVHRAKEYIMAGDMMQVQIGQRLTSSYRDAPLSLYRALRSLNPRRTCTSTTSATSRSSVPRPRSRCAGDPPHRHREQRRRSARGARHHHPPAGRHPPARQYAGEGRPARHRTAQRPQGNRRARDADRPARNDIGRIAETGSVKVTDKMVIEKYSHVQHIVSSVEGRLKDGMTNLDVLRASFPAGTLSGAPKVRAMEIIDELEPRKRGIYGGAVGYLSFGGEMDLAIAIRTGIIKDGNLYVQAAAGIVADSDPEAEWRETEAKARAVIRAAEQVQDGRTPTSDPEQDRRNGHAADDRQLRFLYLQPRAVFRRTRRRRAHLPQRRDHAGRDRGPGPDHICVSPGPCSPRKPASRWPCCSTSPARCRCWACARATSHRRGLRRQGDPRQTGHARQGQHHRDDPAGRVRRAAQALRRHALSFAGNRARDPARLPGSDGLDAGWRDHGRAPQDPCGRRRAVPPRIHPVRARTRAAGELPQGGLGRGTAMKLTDPAAGAGPLAQLEPANHPNESPMSITPQEALTRCIEHREIFHDEMLHLMRQIMQAQVSPVMAAAILTGLREEGNHRRDLRRGP